MILRECVESKYHAQKKHYRQTRGNFGAYSKLLVRKYGEMLKRRAAR